MLTRDAEHLALLLDGELEPAGAERELRRLAHLAGSVTQHASLVHPAPEFRAGLRSQLLAELGVDPVAATGPTPLSQVPRPAGAGARDWRRSWRVAVATGVASGLIGTTGVAVAARSALPGDGLYSVKRATEQVRLWLATNPADEGRVQLALADERLDELEATGTQLTAAELADLLRDLDAATVAGADAWLASDDTALLLELASFTAAQRERLVALLGGLPIEGRRLVEDLLDVLAVLEQETTERARSCSCEAEQPDECGCDDTEDPPAAEDPDGSTDTDGRDVEPEPERTGEPARAGDVDDRDAEGPEVVPPLPRPVDGAGDAVEEFLDGLFGGVTEAGGDSASSPAPTSSTSDGPGVDPLHGLLGGR